MNRYKDTMDLRQAVSLLCDLSEYELTSPAMEDPPESFHAELREAVAVARRFLRQIRPEVGEWFYSPERGYNTKNKNEEKVMSQFTHKAGQQVPTAHKETLIEQLGLKGALKVIELLEEAPALPGHKTLFNFNFKVQPSIFPITGPEQQHPAEVLFSAVKTVPFSEWAKHTGQTTNGKGKQK